MMKQSNEDLLVLTNVIRVLVSPEETNHTYAVFEENVPPLGGPPPHMHPDEEIFYVLEGAFEFVLHDVTTPFKAKAGSVVHVPSMALHAFKNVGDVPGKMVVVLGKGDLIDYFRTIGTPLTEQSQWPDLTCVPDLKTVDVKSAVESGERFNIKFDLPEFFS